MSNHFVYIIIRLIILVVAKPFIRLRSNSVTHGHSGPKIYTANHPSTLDPLMVTAVLKDRVSILLTYSVFNIPIIGYLLKKSGHIPVVDNQGKYAYQQALLKLRSGQSILIFPEGKLSDGQLTSIFSGAVRLAMETGAPIVPIGIGLNGKIIQKQITIKSKTDIAKFFVLGKYYITFGDITYLKGNTTDKSNLDLSKKDLIESISKLASLSRYSLYSPSYSFIETHK